MAPITPHPRTPARPARRPARTAVAAVALALGAAVLTACGAGEEHNDADVAFATQMIPHHAQAVEMAAMVGGKDVAPEVADLATEIAAAQDPEITTMSGWLEQWGEPVPDPEAASGDMSGMTGMMSPEQMTSLEGADGAAFETGWLELMREHHRGAIEMAEAEQADGQDPEAVALAEEIEATQTAEVAEIEQLLADG